MTNKIIEILYEKIDMDNFVVNSYIISFRVNNKIKHFD